MIDWLRRLRGSPGKQHAADTPPLQGIPAVRRTKTYSALSGYVFQYVYAGYRQQGPDAERPTGQTARDYVFLVASQRQAEQELGIRLPDAIPIALARHAGRPVSPKECYALAKLKLFRVLDEWNVADNNPGVIPMTACVTPEEAMEFWETLDL